MKRPTLWIVTAAVVFFARGALAVQQDVNMLKPGAQGRLEPNQLRHRDDSKMPDPQHIREMRQRARERMTQRRSRMADGNGVARDVNIHRRMPRDFNEAMLKERAARQQMSEQELKQRQMQVAEKHSAGEESKHRDRVARLKRIRELAEKQGDTATVTRVDNLLQKENKMHELVMHRIKRRKDAIAASAAGPAGDGNRPPAGRR